MISLIFLIFLFYVFLIFLSCIFGCSQRNYEADSIIHLRTESTLHQLHMRQPSWLSELDTHSKLDSPESASVRQIPWYAVFISCFASCHDERTPILNMKSHIWMCKQKSPSTTFWTEQVIMQLQTVCDCWDFVSQLTSIPAWIELCIIGGSRCFGPNKTHRNHVIRLRPKITVVVQHENLYFEVLHCFSLCIASIELPRT